MDVTKKEETKEKEKEVRCPNKYKNNERKIVPGKGHSSYSIIRRVYISDGGIREEHFIYE